MTDRVDGDRRTGDRATGPPPPGPPRGVRTERRRTDAHGAPATEVSRPLLTRRDRRRLRRRRTLTGAALAVVVVAGIGYVLLRPAALVATGYAAKVVCSEHYVAGREVADAAGDLPSNPLTPLLRVAAAEDEALDATLVGLFRSTAWHTPGRGCTLAATRPAFPPAAPVEPGPVGAPWPAGSAMEPIPPDVDSDALVAAVDAAFREDDPQGRVRATRAVVVVHDGDLLVERYADGYGPDTPLLGWSMSKSIANAVVGRLVHAGRLAPDATGLQPGWEGDDPRAAITLEHLLRMSSGLAFEEVYDVGTDATRMLFRPGDTSAFAADQPLAAPPGTRWEYSSGTSNIVCDVAQRASGAGPDLVRALVFEPLGMASAVMEPDAAGGPVCSSFTYATARDWARFGLWFLRDGVWRGERLLPPGWVEWSTTPVDLPTEAPYGAHWWLNRGADGSLRMPSVPADAYWASGHDGQQVVVVPSARLVVVRLGLSRDFDGLEWGLEPLLAGVIEAVD